MVEFAFFDRRLKLTYQNDAPDHAKICPPFGHRLAHADAMPASISFDHENKQVGDGGVS